MMFIANFGGRLVIVKVSRAFDQVFEFFTCNLLAAFDGFCFKWPVEMQEVFSKTDL